MVRSLVGFLSLVILLTGCSAAKFSSKSDVLGKNSVFASEGDDTGPNPELMDDIARELVQGPADESTVTIMCSDSRSEKATNFKKAVANGLPVQLSVGTKNCTSNPQTIVSLIVRDKINRADLETVCAAALPAQGTPLALSVTINGSVNMSQRGRLTVLYARNDDTSVPSEAADANCDKNASPLVVHMASDVNNPQPIDLSSPEDGVDFDLLGKRNDHQSVRISWFTNKDYRFLALPDENGEVRSIEQLFGDNTSGPDGAFADNGYAALAKYDGTSSDGMLQLARADSRIDARDPIFRKLHLWLDANFDGIGQANEMVALSRVGIAYIDLEYSSDYAESDRFGNETKMKSIVGYRDGSMDLIFDLWFSYR